MEWVERQDPSQTPLSPNEKKHGRITHINASSQISVILLQVPNTYSDIIKRRIGPLRHTTLRHVPELVMTQEVRTIEHDQVTGLLNVFNAEDVVDGAKRISGMRNYYVVRYLINSNLILTPVTSFSSFPSDYTEYRERFGAFPCIHKQLHELRQEIGDYMQSILCNTGDRQGSSNKCRQRKYYHGFGTSKWQLLLYLFQYYSTDCIPRVFKFEKSKIMTVLKPSLAVSRSRLPVTEEVVILMYPQDFMLFIALFGENSLRGVRNKRPRKGENDVQLRPLDKLNRLVCYYTVEEGAEYYAAGCPWPGADPEDKHYVKLVYDGKNRLLLQVRYACVVIGAGDIEQLTESSLALPEGNVAQELIGGARENRLFVGLMFSVPVEDEVHPYNQFGEIAWRIESIVGSIVEAKP